MTSPKNSFEIAFDVIGTKEVTEAIFKNLTWFLACAPLIRLIPTALVAGKYSFALMAFLVFVFLMGINFLYGVRNILLPVDDALGDHLSKIKAQNHHPNQTNGTRAKRLWSFLFGTKLGIGYLAISLLYVWFVFELIEMVARFLGPK